jgi:anti-sigma B factor antagonist
MSDHFEALHLQGELTIYTVAEQKTRLLDALARGDGLDINLSNVTEIDSAGLQLLILAKREATSAGKRLRLCEHSPAASELIELYNLAGWFGDPLVIPARQAEGRSR